MKKLLLSLVFVFAVAFSASNANAAVCGNWGKIGACKLDFSNVKEYKRYVNCRLTTEEQDYIRRTAEEQGLSFDLVMKLIKIESNYRKDARSYTGDLGVMQINRVNEEHLKYKLGISSLLKFEDNVQAGCYILGGLKEKYKEDGLVLMAYNMGEAGARRLWEKGVYSSNYSRKVLGAEIY